MDNLLKKLNLLSEDGTVSITNSVVLIFVIITAIRTLLSGVIISYHDIFTWKIQELDMAATLPLLMSLSNYAHKRIETNKVINKTETKEVKNEE